MIEVCEQKKARTTLDVIEELDRQAPKFKDLLLIISDGDSFSYINGSQANRLDALDTAIAGGGEPLGFIGYVLEEDGARFYYRVLDGFPKVEEAEDYLNGVIGMVAEFLNSKNSTRTLSN